MIQQVVGVSFEENLLARARLGFYHSG